jgi:hypothetical protein
MSVILYLIFATILLMLAIIGATSASIETSGLRWFDRTITPDDDRQHKLLGECVTWSSDIASGAWRFIAISYGVIFSFAAVSKPLSSIADHQPMPTQLVAAGLVSAVVILAALRAMRYKSRKLIRQYHEIRAGKEPAWAASKV